MMKTSRTKWSRPRWSVRPSIDRSGLPGRDDERVAELVEPEVDPELADRRCSAEPVEVADHLLALSLEPRLLVRQPVDIDGGGRDLDGLGEREEAEDEDDRDRPEQDSNPVRLASRPDRRPCPTARDRRCRIHPGPRLDGGRG